MAGEGAFSIDPARDALRDQALADLDALMRIAAETRRDIRSYQTAVQKTYRQIAKTGRGSDVVGLFDVSAVRSSFADGLSAIERARSSARRSLWQLQVSEGMAIAEIARAWGFSRQLVSRALAPRADGRS